jgi:hypothetical protein
MKSSLVHAALAVSVLGLILTLSLSASARDVVLPAGTILQCTLNEPNFSTSTAEIGDPVLCHLRAQTEFGRQAFPRGSYLVGHLEAAKDPGHFWGKGYLKLQFDRIGLPSGDLPLETKVIATRGYKVDKEGKVDGKGHAKRDVVEWMLPPLWPWKVIMLPARGPRPALKGETQLSLRLMDDVQLPEVAETFGPDWHFFDRFKEQGYNHRKLDQPAPQFATQTAQPQASYATYVMPDVPAPSVAKIASAPGMPLFVLTSGTVLAVSGYGYQDNRISYSLVGGGSGVINSGDVDWDATTELNNQRGVRLTLHSGRLNSAVSGM